jgi:signal transduction histidine kinase
VAPEDEEAWIARSITAVWDGPTPNSTTREFPDGRTIWGLNTQVGSGGMIFVIRDITERLAQEKQLAEMLARERELTAQQRRFVTVTAHEFRTPLTIIDGAAQRLVRGPDGVSPEELRERVARIRAAVARMAQLIDSTLNLARVDAGKIRAALASVDLGAAVTAMCHRIEGAAPGFVVALVQPAAPIVIQADTALLDQIVTNLVSNAIKYSGKSRRVEVTVASAAESATIAVRDFGIGIPEAELDQVFQRFFRASTAQGLPGTGIGLELVRELVGLHGGRIAVESRVGEGSCFTVTLPIAAPATLDVPSGAVPRLEAG